MSAAFQFTGLDRVIRNIKKAGASSLVESKKGLDEFGLVIINEADKIVPFDTGELENSVINEPVKNNEKVIGYDTPYASIQHENTSLIHPGPRSTSPSRGSKGQPKYLENPLKANTKKLGDIVAFRMKTIL